MWCPPTQRHALILSLAGVDQVVDEGEDGVLVTGADAVKHMGPRGGRDKRGGGSSRSRNQIHPPNEIGQLRNTRWVQFLRPNEINHF